AFVIAKKPKYADQGRVIWQRIEYRECPARCPTAGLGSLHPGQKRQWMVDDVVNPVEMSDIARVPPVVGNCGDAFAPLHAGQAVRNPPAELARVAITLADFVSRLEPHSDQCAPERAIVEFRRQVKAVKADGQPRRRRDQPTKPTQGIAPAASERSMFKLQVDG